MKIRDRRVKLKKGKQKKLIRNIAKKYGSLKNLAFRLNIPLSTLKNYACGARLIPENLFNKIIKLSKDYKIEKLSYLPSNWGASLGGKKGMATLQKKYPKELIKWRMKGAQNSKPHNTKKIKEPKLDEKLAEFIGVYLGDGTLTKYFIRISGDYRYDILYFNYLIKLIHELFGLEAKISKEKKHNTAYITIFSKKLCSFLKERFGLNPGHKIRNNTLIPLDILNNSKLSLACLRGLIDTDGSVSRRGTGGKQFTIVLTSHNKNLIDQIKNISDKHELFTFTSKNYDEIGTNSRERILKYFKDVGSSNMRHIVRFHQRMYKNNTIYRREVINYYQKDFYRNLSLPFKINMAL